MRVDILHQVSSSTFDANGNATVTMSPAVGQYWAPFVIRVACTTGTNTYLTINPYAALYYGAIGVTDSGTIVDDTIQGNKDASGVLSGTIVQPGETLTVKWSGGPPGGRVIMDLYGQTSDTPPSLGFSIPQIMGPHFVGKPIVPQSWQAPNLLNAQPLIFFNPGPAASVNLLFGFGANEQLYLHSMQWHWETAVAGLTGAWGISSDNTGADSATDTTPRTLDWGGLPLGYGNNFTFFQLSGTAANSSRCVGTIVYAVQPFITPST